MKKIIFYPILTLFLTILLTLSCQLSSWEDIVGKFENASKSTGNPPNITINSMIEFEFEVLFNLKLDKDGKIYCIAVAQGSQPPTANQVKAGNDYDGVTVVRYDKFNCSQDTDYEWYVGGLGAFQSYDIYFAAEDSEGNLTSDTEVENNKQSVQTRSHQIAVGSTYNGADSDWYMKEYDAFGNSRFQNNYNISGNNEEAFDVAIDSYKNIYVVGYEEHTSTKEDWFIRKFNKYGNEIVGNGWPILVDSNQTDAGAEKNDRALAIVIDKYDNIYVGGYFNSYSTGINETHWRVIKYDSNGIEQWSLDPSITGKINDLVIDSSASYLYVVGYNEPSAGAGHWYILSIDANTGTDKSSLEESWGGFNEATSVAITSDNQYIYVAGSYWYSSTNWYWRVKKYLIDGTGAINDIVVQYSKDFFGSYDKAMDIAVDNTNYVYVAGIVTSGSVTNWQVIKLDSDLSSEIASNYWDNSIEDDILNGITIDSQNNIFICGSKANNSTGHTDFCKKKLEGSSLTEDGAGSEEFNASDYDIFNSIVNMP